MGTMAGISVNDTLLLLGGHGGMSMKKMNAFVRAVVALFVVTGCLYSQNTYPITRLTSDSTREGFPSWSPDGKTIVYSFFNIVEGKSILGSRKISSGGGTPIQFTDFPTEHPQWSPDGRFIVFDADTGASIRMIEAEGGSPIRFLPDSIGIYSGGLPCWSPTGSHIAFKDGTTSSVWIYEIKTGTVSRIFREEGMLPLPGCWSRDGKSILIALMDRKSRVSTMWKISIDGRERQQITGHHGGFYRYLVLSPDGTLLVYAAMEEKKLGLWIMPAKGGKSLPLVVSHQDHNECPAWSPDGKRIAFASGRTGRGDIYIMELEIERVRGELTLLNQ
jgi:Tol biopolymer transport system component